MKKITAFALTLILMISAIYPVYSADKSTKLDVPKIEITTQNGKGVDLKKADGYVDASVKITDIDNTSLSDSVVFKVRGNSTAFDSIGKKSYTFKFAKKKELFSMGSGKKWALISNVYDPTLARNYVAFSLAQKLGIQYTSNFKVVELWLDKSFRGCYMLFEPVGEGKDRVDIDLKGNDGKKDFLLELEASRVEDDVTYITSNGMRFAISEPDPPTEEQASYIKSTVDDVIRTIRYGTKEEIEGKIDIESFSKFYILNEFLKTVDFNFSSVFYYYKDGKLYAGPPWDYDLSSGNVNKDFSSNYASSYKTDGLFINNKNLYNYLCDYDWFNDTAKKLFVENYPYFKSIYSEGGVIDTFYKTYKKPIERNFSGAGWSVSRYYVNVMKYPLATYAENYDFYVNWCNKRVEWLADYYEIDTSTVPATEETTTEEPTTKQVTTAAVTTAEPTTSAPEVKPSETAEPSGTTEPIETTATTAPTEISTTEPEETTSPKPSTAQPTTEASETTVTEPPVSSEPVTSPTTPEPTAPVKPVEPVKPVVIPYLCGTVNLMAGSTVNLPALDAGFVSSNKNVATVKNGKVTALKKGTADIAAVVGNIKYVYKTKVVNNPSLSKKSITVKKGKTKSVTLIGKVKSVKNTYKNTKKVKIISKRSADKIKIRGLKKGKTTLKIFVNGYKLKLKVKVK
jgi:hypothetical protein